MLSLKEIDLRFLIISHSFWGIGDNLVLLKRKASRDSKWPKGATRVYFLYLVHKDTTMENEQMVFPSDKARETALYLGTI